MAAARNSNRKVEALALHVIPRAKKNALVGIQDDGRVRIRLNAIPEGGKANRALIEFLAETLQVPASRIRIVAGANSQDKLVKFEGMEVQEIIVRIIGLLS